MPKHEASATDAPLTARQAADKIAGLITSPDESQAESDDRAPAADSPAAPTPPAPSPQDEEPAAKEPPASDESESEGYLVTVDGETLHVDLDELKAGYAKHEDYKRKTMALAEERKAFEAESHAVQTERAEYAENIRQLRQALEAIQGEPDWAERRKVLSPEDFLREKADWEVSKAQTEKLKAKEHDLLRQQQADEAKRFQAHMRAEHDKLRTLLPDWADPEKAKAESARLRLHAKTYGFSDDEIASGFNVDHRLVLLLRDALKYKELQREPSDKAKAKTPAIRTAKPGAAPPPPPPNARQQQLIERVSQTHRQRDAVEAIKALLPD